MLTTMTRPDAGAAWVAGHDVSPIRSRCAASSASPARTPRSTSCSPARQNLELVGILSDMPRAAARDRSAELLEQFELTVRRRPDGEDVLRRHAPSARPRRQPDGAPAGAVPRRAHHRPRPHQPPAHVGRHPRPRRRRHHRAAHHAVPRRGRHPGRHHLGDRPRPRHRRGHRPRAQGEHRRRAPRGHARTRRRRARCGRARAARVRRRCR